MGREVRRVPADWDHPSENLRSTPLMEGYGATVIEFEAMQKEKGLQEAIDWFGSAPDKNKYMPDWAEEEKTHYQMYENVSEGTPVSPPMESPEKLAQWLVDNNGDAGAGGTASYKGWLRVANGGYAPSMVFCDGVMKSGVEALTD